MSEEIDIKKKIKMLIAFTFATVFAMILIFTVFMICEESRKNREEKLLGLIHTFELKDSFLTDKPINLLAD